MAGYSGTPLPRKLGLPGAARVVLLGAPDGFAAGLGELPGTTIRSSLRGPADVVMAFVTSRAVLERRITAIADAIRPSGACWVAWPKKASKVPTDMTRMS